MCALSKCIDHKVYRRRKPNDMASAFHDLRPEQVPNAVTQSFPNVARQTTVDERERNKNLVKVAKIIYGIYPQSAKVSTSARGGADHVRDLAALVVLEEREVPEAHSNAGSAGWDGPAYLVLKYEYHFEPPKQKETYAGVDFVYVSWCPGFCPRSRSVFVECA
jgi:hypothetical protein